VVIENLSVVAMSFPSPHPPFFLPSSPSFPLMATETLLVKILCDPVIKMGLLMETHWELKWNMLCTNGKIENNPSLLKVKFDAIL